MNLTSENLASNLNTACFAAETMIGKNVSISYTFLKSVIVMFSITYFRGESEYGFYSSGLDRSRKPILRGIEHSLTCFSSSVVDQNLTYLKFMNHRSQIANEGFRYAQTIGNCLNVTCSEIYRASKLKKVCFSTPFFK